MGGGASNEKVGGLDAYEELSGEAPEAPHHALLDARILAKLCEA